jgi:phosphoglycolate phosphatase-like HAD superfamily hydrolase
MKTIEYLKNSNTIFWDFDGVIKDSVEVKSNAFEQLFLPFGKGVADKIRRHHEANGGMSRFDKLPIYLEWVEQESTQENIDKYIKKFSLLVKNKVINSEWVEGVFDYLKNNHKRQQFFLITATPQHEIEDIINQLNISDYFRHIVGSPTKKKDALRKIITKFLVNTEKSIMVGDSTSDYEASILNKVPFILRKTHLNKDLQNKLNTLMIQNYK